MAWTKEQQQAIDLRGKNILVAAAAGSGKTAVLVERIKKLIIEDGVSIDRMLIVTFTNAAAAEMKEKIRKALIGEIEKDPEHSAALRAQLALLPRANISTFHAFALDVIRRFFYQAEVEPGFSICDEAQRTILKEDSMDILLEKYFAEAAGEEGESGKTAAAETTDDAAEKTTEAAGKSESAEAAGKAGETSEFYEFLNWYSGDRNQNRIREMIDSAYSVLQSLPYPWKWLDEKVEMLNMDPSRAEDSPLMEHIWGYIDESLKEASEFWQRACEILADAGLDRMAEKVEAEEVSYGNALLEAAEERKFEQLRILMESAPSLRLTAKKEEKEDYATIKEMVATCRKQASACTGEIKKMFFLAPLSEQIEELNKTAPRAETLKKLLLSFDGIFRAAKAEKKLLDFNDIEHYCLEILEEDETAEFYRRKFEYIFIDEYQDTNILQEEIISRIKRENNLFMVGDIKQSIYKFRLAEPEIFKGKYISYGSGDENSVKIDLNRNFRSKPVILSEINRIFDGLMEDYTEEARLYPGLDYKGECSYLPEVKVVDVEAAGEADEALANLKNTELEALAVCRIIRENLGKPFYDHKAGVMRRIRLRDIVILMRGVKNYADVFYNILKENGIESFVDDSEGYFDTMEITVFMNLLSVIDNKLQDIPLISVLHSEIFGFSAEELGRVRAENKQGSFAESWIRYAESGGDGLLREKCGKALASIKEWKQMSASMPLGKFIWSLLMETGYYLIIGAMPAGAQRQANLRALVDRAESYSRGRQSSLYSFVRYIDAVKQRKVPMGQVRLVGENDDLVRIMTIHKSKGLEFPMVIVSGMGRRLNYTKLGSGAALHKDIGIAMTLADYEGRWYKQTLLQRLMQKQIRREEVQEEIRILYVALTRAKDILYMTGTVKDGEKFTESRETGLGSEAMYLSMLSGASSLELIDANLLSAGETEKTVFFGNPMDRDIYTEEPDEKKAKEIRERLSYVYPYEAARHLKSKYSVTEVNRMETEKVTNFEPVLAVPKFRREKKQLTAAQRGTVYHGIMERIDFSLAAAEGEAYLKRAVSEMIEAEIFTPEEIEGVKLSRITDFFAGNLGRRCAAAYSEGRLQRERSFNLAMELSGEQVLVQGIIDCFFEEEGALVLLDYKTSRIDREKTFEEEAERLRASYAKQIEIYSRALSAATGKQVKEAYLYLFDAGCSIDMETK